MTFLTPNVAGVFIHGLSRRLASAVTDGMAQHYMLGGCPTRLRNDLGFHAALVELVEALLERLVLPYQVTGALSSVDQLSTAQLGLVDGLQIPVSVPDTLKDPDIRKRLGTERRYAPFEFWMDVLKCTADLAASSNSVIWPSGVSYSENADVVVLPACIAPLHWRDDRHMPAVEYGFVDIGDSGWDTAGEYGVPQFLHGVPPYGKLVTDVYGMLRGSHYGGFVMNILLKLPFDFVSGSPWSGYGWAFAQEAVRPFPFAFFPVYDEEHAYKPDEDSWSRGFLYGSSGEPPHMRDHLSRSAVRFWRFTPQVKDASPSPLDPDVTKRANLDLMRVYQSLLGGFWANWAVIRMEVHVPHIVTTRVTRYEVAWDGSLQQIGDPVESTRRETRISRLFWTHDVSASVEGAWDNGNNLYSGSVGFDLHLDPDVFTEFLRPIDEVDETVSDARARIAEARAGLEAAERVLSDAISALNTALDTAFADIPQSAKEAFADAAIEGVFGQGRPVNTVRCYFRRADGTLYEFSRSWIYYPEVERPWSRDAVLALFERLKDLFREYIARYQPVFDTSMSSEIMISADYGPGVVIDVAAFSDVASYVHDVQQAYIAAVEAREEASRNYESVYNRYIETYTLGVEQDCTYDVVRQAVGGSRSWDDYPPHQPGEGSIVLSVTSTETHPLADGLATYILKRDYPAPVRESEWPAAALLSQYVAREDAMIGLMFPDRIDEEYGNTGYFNYEDCNYEPPEGESWYVATRYGNSHGERYPSMVDFRRLAFCEIDGVSETSPVEGIDSFLADLVDNATNRVSGPTVGGALPMRLLNGHSFGTQGNTSTNQWTDGLGPFTAWFHPDKSRVAYRYIGSEPDTHDAFVYLIRGEPPPPDYVSLDAYIPWQITENSLVLWDFDRDGLPPVYVSATFEYHDDAHSQSGGVSSLPHGDELDIRLSQHFALRAVWNWQSMPVLNYPYSGQ